MASYYLDTSALVKCYALEAGTTWMNALREPDAGHTLYTVRLTGPELIAALSRAVDFVRHDIDGLLYPVGDIEALARHLQALAIGDDSFHHLQHGCREAAAALNWDAAILPRMATLYRHLLR